MAARIQRKRTKGWRMPENTVYVGRPTKWGNPFPVALCIEAGFAATEVEARRVCVDAFRDWLNGDTWAAGESPDWPSARKAMLDHLHELRGKNLACFCPLDQPCHADVLLELANEPQGSVRRTTMGLQSPRRCPNCQHEGETHAVWCRLRDYDEENPALEQHDENCDCEECA